MPLGNDINLVPGFTGSAKQWNVGTAAPTTGPHAPGETVWNATPGPGAPLAWFCTVAGEPGTWASFGMQPLVASVVYNPPSLLTGVQDTVQTLACPGAVFGDRVEVTFSLDLNGVALRAWVSAADTVKFVFDNRTAGTLDLASGTVTVKVYH